MRIFGATILPLFAGVILLGAQSPEPKKAATRASAPMEIFLDNCAKCHGPDGNADTWMGRKHNMPKFPSDEVQKLSDKDLTTIIRKGKNRMPSWEDRLSAEEIAKVLTVVRGFGQSAKSDGGKR